MYHKKRTYLQATSQNFVVHAQILRRMGRRMSIIKVNIGLSFFFLTLTVLKWSNKLTWPSRPAARRRAYSAFLIECIDTASVIVSTRPDVPPVIRIRKLLMSIDERPPKVIRLTYYLTQHAHFSSFQILSNSWMSCTASCS